MTPNLQHELQSPAHEKPLSKRLAWIAVLAAIAAAVLFLLSRAGSFLVVDDPEPSDVIVVLEESRDTPGFDRALELQRQGYAPRILLDADVNRGIYGRSEADLAKQYLEREHQRAVEICPVTGATVVAETADVKRCMQRIGATSAILMTSDFETRRTLSIFRRLLPQYRWSVAAASTPYHFAEAYWKHRGWAKTVVVEWEEFLWWKLFDQWRSDAVLH